MATGKYFYLDANGNLKEEAHGNLKTNANNVHGLRENSIILGSGSFLDGNNAVVIGRSAQATGNDAVAIGYNASATEANDFVLGNANHNVKVPGTLVPLEAHLSDNMPHQFMDNDTSTTYKYGLKQEDGHMVFMYEEVS